MRLYHIYYTAKDRIKDQSLCIDDCFEEIRFFIDKKYGIKTPNLFVNNHKIFNEENISIIAVYPDFYKEFTLKLDTEPKQEKTNCSKCGIETESIYKDYQTDVNYCEDCWNVLFTERQREKALKWFEDNFERNEYPKEFWDKLEE